jgi:hypothetical protein
MLKTLGTARRWMKRARSVVARNGFLSGDMKDDGVWSDGEEKRWCS